MKFENLNEDIIKEISKKEPQWLINDRLLCLSIFNELDDDSFKYGLTIKTDVSEIKVDDFKSKFNLIIKNDDERVVIKDFKESFEDYEDLIKKYFMKELKSKLDFLHKAISQDCILVYIPKNVKVKNLVILDYEFLENNSFDHLLIVADENSKINILEILNNGNKIFRNGFVEVYARNNSNVNFFSLQNLNNDVNNFSTKKAFIGKDAQCNFYNFDFGSSLNHSHVESKMIDSGASSNIKCIYFSNEKQHFDLSYNTVHKAENTSSTIYARGVLDDYSNSIYKGLIKVESNAPNSSGYQKEDVLLISENAKADSIPNLEIENNEIKCSHGTTISHLDKERMFYLMSRGVNEKESAMIMIEGFLLGLIENIDDELKRMITELVRNKIKWMLRKIFPYLIGR